MARLSPPRHYLSFCWIFFCSCTWTAVINERWGPIRQILPITAKLYPRKLHWFQYFRKSAGWASKTETLPDLNLVNLSYKLIFSCISGLPAELLSSDLFKVPDFPDLCGVRPLQSTAMIPDVYVFHGEITMRTVSSQAGSNSIQFSSILFYLFNSCLRCFIF